MAYPYVEMPYNENLSPKYNRGLSRSMRFGESREAAVVKAQSPTGYPASDYASALTVQIFLRPTGLQNRSGVAGNANLGLLDGD